MEILISVICLLIGLAIGYLLCQSKSQSALSSLQSQRDVLQSKVADSARQTEDLRADFEKQKQELKANHERQLAELRQAQRDQLEQQLKLIREQMNSASEKILKERAEELSENNKQQLSSILNPLHENIRQMKEAVEKSDRQQNESMTRLDQSIKENMKQAREVGERADKLASALTSENKTQGNFGELRLKQVLESMGLEEGLQFEEQATMKDEQGHTIYEEDGHRLIPDVILHFPDSRDVIIDSKMSFKAFEDYHNADTDQAREEALRRHILSVRNHVNELARKNYSKYIRDGRHRLDFVMMYVFSEGALQLALAHEPGLWKEAYDKGVVIAGSQNLYMMLRVLEMTWKQVRQVENQQEIMKAANTIIDRVQLFYERFLKVDEQLRKTQEAFDDVKRTTQPSGLSIMTAARQLITFGGEENPKRKVRIAQDNTATQQSLEKAESNNEGKK
ncbi:DNA recombination protein RmuC [Prevotella sp. A2931]|uniref:DNA recombination protein RmuC n=1 Tax=Prevotella illustrans TaxID=2800387 RepID=A0ABS3M5G6_9BACT|nr:MULTISPECIES: DNA recombination protein RmuC [Prevotella]MBO1363374.1 DNA recombination protein RmuC [Prevotella illustrans]PTL27006.1 DNA recombination protein RmuC [Prevotella sp. oral taxon 820]